MRTPMVTRTIVTTKCDVLCVDVNSAETFNSEVVLPSTYKDGAKLLKAVQKRVDTDLVKAVAIVSTDIVETMYGMEQTDFIEHATVLDPTTRKATE